MTAVHSGQVLNVFGDSQEPGASIIQWRASEMADNSEWCFVDVGEGYYQIRSRSSGLVIDVDNLGEEDGRFVETFDEAGGHETQ